MSDKKVDYQTLSAELDEIMARLQSDEVGVEEAVQLYEQGMKTIEQLQKHLKEAENKVEKIKARFKTME